MMIGRVTQVIRSRACGFIRAADGQQVFFHASDLQQMVFDQLEEKQSVRFSLVADAVSGPRAVQVRPARPTSSAVPASRR